MLMVEQAGFRKGRLCTDNTFILWQIIEKQWEFMKIIEYKWEFNLEMHVTNMDFQIMENKYQRTSLQSYWDITKNISCCIFGC